MRLPSLRDVTPRSLYGRVILIVVLPIFLMQAIVTWLFFDRHWEEVTARLAKGAAAELGYVTALYAEAPPGPEREAILAKAERELEVDIAWRPGEVVPAESRKSAVDPFDRVLRRELAWHLTREKGHAVWYDAQRSRFFEIRVQLPEGVLSFTLRRDRVLATNGPFFVVWLVVTTLLIGYIAVVFLRNQVRSITRLADAAEAFGRGRDAPGFKPSGAREVRQAGHAFLAMRARIRRTIRQRTEMLAGVSHDLRTPLTRMKLTLALQDDTEDVAELKADVEEMSRMVEEYLTFVSDEDEVPVEEVNLAALAAEVAQDQAREGRDLSVDVAPGLTVPAQRVSLKRALGNLAGNAFLHAKTVRLSAERREDDVILHVDDDGPGIPAERREEAMRAFTRLDPARSGAHGTGLGLAIVRDVARRHGGGLVLSDSPMGGLRASLRLPLSSPLV